MPRNSRFPLLGRLTDDEWARVEPIVESDLPRPSTGRPRADRRRILAGILFQLHTACPWNHLPGVFGDDSTVHRYYRRWGRNGVLEQLLAALGDASARAALRDGSADAAGGNGNGNGNGNGTGRTPRPTGGRPMPVPSGATDAPSGPFILPPGPTPAGGGGSTP